MSELQTPENGGAHDNVGSKRHRRPNVRLGDIGGGNNKRQLLPWPKSNWKTSKNRQLVSNHSLTLIDNDNSNSRNFNWSDDEDDDTIGSWKKKDFKSKKPTKRLNSNWASKATDKLQNTDVEDLDNNESSGHSPRHSHDNNQVNGNVNGRERVSEEGPTDTEARDWNCGSERNGVRAWLDQLGLGRYAPLFQIHEVDDDVLPMLTLEDLKDMGITAVGSRRKMYCAIQKLNKDFS